MKQIDVMLAKTRGDEVIPIGGGKYLVLSSNKKDYYTVNCHPLKGNQLPTCTCKARQYGHIECSHLKKVAQFVEMNWPYTKKFKYSKHNSINNRRRSNQNG